MILEKNKEATVTVFGGEENGRFSINVDDISHLMDILSELYSNPEAAVIREYLTNAMDSHIAAGKKDTPIDIRTPTRFSPMFEVQDYGLGLSKEEVFSIYSSYGTSTKQTSNDFNGQLGLGSKSAFAVSRQFSLTSVKDGEKYVFSMYKNEDNEASVTLLDSSPTDECNGVTISIPVKDGRERVFESNVTSFLNHFDFPILRNGQVVTRAKPQTTIDHNGIRFNFHICSYHSNRELSGQVCIRMGGVVYPLDISKMTTSFAHGNNYIIIDVPIGAVNFTPSREALRYNGVTNSFLRRIDETIRELLEEDTKELQVLADKATSAEEVFTILKNSTRGMYLKWLGPISVRWRGVDFSDNNIAYFETLSYTLDSRGFLYRKEGNIAPGFTRATNTLYVITDKKDVTNNMRLIAKEKIRSGNYLNVTFLFPFSTFTAEETYLPKDIITTAEFMGTKVKRKRSDGPAIYRIKFEYGRPKIATLTYDELDTKTNLVLVHIHAQEPQMQLPWSNSGYRSVTEFFQKQGYFFFGIRTQTARGRNMTKTANLEKFDELGIPYLTMNDVMAKYLESINASAALDRVSFDGETTFSDAVGYLKALDLGLPVLDELAERYTKSRQVNIPLTNNEILQLIGKPKNDIPEKIKEVYAAFPLLRAIMWNQASFHTKEFEDIQKYVSWKKENV